MCLAVPGRLLSDEGKSPLSRTGQVDFGGVRRTVNLCLVPEAEIGDHLLVHAGVAIAVLSPLEAKRSFMELEKLDMGK